MNLLFAIGPSDISAAAACAAVAVAVFFHSRNLAATRLSNSAKMVHDLNQIWNSPEMREHRRNFAAKLVKPSERHLVDLREDNPVMEFFEELGYLTRREVLDAGMVWNSFCWPFEPYYLAVTSPENLIKIAQDAAGTKSLYQELPRLKMVMQEISAIEEGGNPVWTAHEVVEFLKGEVHWGAKEEEPPAVQAANDEPVPAI